MRGPVRALGLRQDHPDPPCQRAGRRLLGGKAYRRGARRRAKRRRIRRMAARRAYRQRVSEPPHAVLQPRHDGRDRLRPREPGRPARRDACARGTRGRRAGCDRPARSLDLQALGRPDAVDRLRKRFGLRAKGLRARRAVEQPGSRRHGAARCTHRQGEGRGFRGACRRASPGLPLRCRRHVRPHRRGSGRARMDPERVRSALCPGTHPYGPALAGTAAHSRSRRTASHRCDVGVSGT